MTRKKTRSNDKPPAPKSASSTPPEPAAQDDGAAGDDTVRNPEKNLGELGGKPDPMGDTGKMTPYVEPPPDEDEDALERENDQKETDPALAKLADATGLPVGYFAHAYALVAAGAGNYIAVHLRDVHAGSASPADPRAKASLRNLEPKPPAMALAMALKGLSDRTTKTSTGWHPELDAGDQGDDK